MKIEDLLPVYLKHLKVIGRSYYTIRGITYALRDFFRFLEDVRVSRTPDLTTEVIEAYQEELAFRMTRKGTPLHLSTQVQLICNIRGFTEFLHAHDYLFQDPGLKVKPPKPPQSLPKVILDEKEIRRLMQAPDMQTHAGFRNRVILEVLYDTAIRRLELSRIRLADLDVETGYIRIHGKGDRDRVVPVSPRVCDLIQNYLRFVRPHYVQGHDCGYFILNRWGRRMAPNAVWDAVRSCVRLSGIPKRVSTHTLRHTCATHMLRNGAPVRYIQEMLGHESLKSTQVYTHVTINDLKKIHAQYHPGEQL